MYIYNRQLLISYAFPITAPLLLASKSHSNSMALFPQDRAGTNSPLDFEVVGGSEYGSEIFVASVKPESMPEAAGLLVGDLVRVGEGGGSGEGRESGGVG